MAGVPAPGHRVRTGQVSVDSVGTADPRNTSKALRTPDGLRRGTQMSKDQVHPPRGLATATYSGLAVVGLAALALVGASGPAAASPHEGEGARPASAQQREPPCAPRAEARRVGRRLLALAVLPPGTHRLVGQRVPAELRHPSQ